MARIRSFMVFEAVTFLIAALIHFGVVLDGYAHRAAGIAETVIGAVLLLGILLSLLRPGWTARVGLGAQGFALLGTLVGIFTIIIGVGPRTAPDIAYHLAIVIVLGAGLVAARRGLDVPGARAR